MTKSSQIIEINPDSYSYFRTHHGNETRTYLLFSYLFILRTNESSAVKKHVGPTMESRLKRLKRIGYISNLS